MATEARKKSTTPGPGVVIRAVRIDDAGAIHEMRQQPSILAYTAALPSDRIEKTRSRIEGFDSNDHVLVAEVEGRVVGLAGLHVLRGKQRHVADLGMMVHDAFQGRGIGRQLLMAVLDVADSHLGLIRVELEVLSDNARAVKLYESCGFAHEGRKRKAFRHRGCYEDLLVMARVC